MKYKHIIRIDRLTEYITIKPESTDDPELICLMTNLDLTAGGPPESYASPQEGDEGSPLAQAIWTVPGVAELRLDGREVHIRREADVEWHDLIEDVTDVLKDFFL
jgi:Scaffold protein Nfu/NifU N terminal